MAAGTRLVRDDAYEGLAASYQCVQVAALDAALRENRIADASSVRQSCERAAAFKATAQKMGVKVTGEYWTLGAFDGVIICEAPDEETATAALLHLGSLGSIRTQTARAYDAAEMQKILGMLPK